MDQTVRILSWNIDILHVKLHVVRSCISSLAASKIRISDF